MQNLPEVHHRLCNKLPRKLIIINSIIFCSKARAHFNLSSLIPTGFVLLRVCQIKTLECTTSFPQGGKEQTMHTRQTSHPLILCEDEFRYCYVHGKFRICTVQYPNAFQLSKTRVCLSSPLLPNPGQLLSSAVRPLLPRSLLSTTDNPA